MANYGWIALPRNIVEHWLWDKPRRLRMWLSLVIDAAWTDTSVFNGKKYIEIKRGQVATSTRKLMTQWGCHSEMATSFLKALEESQLISREFRGNLTIISILNYDIYQPILDVAQDSQNEANSMPQPKHLSKQNKEYNNGNKTLTFSHEQEKIFYNQAISDSECKNSLCELFGIDDEVLHNNLKYFNNDISIRKKQHNNYEEFITHFRNWYSKKNAKAAISKNVNENSSDARRGTEISNKSIDRYKSETF